jgi:hypothetical protein
VLCGERVEGEDVLLGFLEHRGDLRQRPLELGDRLAEPPSGLLPRLRSEDWADQRGQQPVLVLASVTETIAQEVDSAALPWAAEHLRQCRLQSRMGVGDRELHANQAALDQAAQELAPERLGLGLADIQADDLAASGLVHGVRDHHALALHTAAITDLLNLRVDEQIRVAALKRPSPERLDLLVEALTDP